MFLIHIYSLPTIFTVLVPGLHVVLSRYVRLKSSFTPPANPVVYTQFIVFGFPDPADTIVPSTPTVVPKFSKTNSCNPFVIFPTVL